jgi:uncharacterized membrane protein YidH (DUF202 family)
MKRSFGGFLIIIGIIVSTYTFSAYNLSSASNPTTDGTMQLTNLLFYLFFIVAIISVIAGVAMLINEKNATE